ncbi:hypothetical protein RhiLY_08310 [Ceratobasidium sp. AG-Ba]|nr:hypothetical protein RhiLY_08310 [Ceratobasidium sp. AG-Ba]
MPRMARMVNISTGVHLPQIGVSPNLEAKSCMWTRSHIPSYVYNPFWDDGTWFYKFTKDAALKDYERTK